VEVFMVGGAVRDRLLGRPVKDRARVVEAATPGDLLDHGYRPVGRDFPVFLHPETGEEYALARTERKTGPGYTGFAVHAAPDVTLEEDLRRRDLTINAMAMTPEGTLVDPFGGRQDLEAGVLRHVSPAFVEDPVRLLRVARFAARYDFRVAPETAALMARMVAAGEVDALVPDRVWAELQGALGEPHPARFVTELRGCGALARLFPEVDRLFGVPQPPRHHPEVDTGAHLLLALEQAARLSPDPAVRFAVLVHDLGKGETPREEWPGHHGHEERGAALVGELARRYPVPNAYRELGELAARYHGHCHRALELRPATVLKLLEATDALRRPERLEALLAACEADARGRTGLEDRPYPQADYLRRARAAAAAVSGAEIAARGLTGKAVGEALRRERIRAIAGVRSGSPYPAPGFRPSSE
jgi:tRNA nucleotidyltransferase (CCA-adding enzyme)